MTSKELDTQKPTECKTISECMGRIFDEEIGADVTFSVGEMEIRAQKLILSKRSSVFTAMFSGNFEQSREVDIPDSDGDDFRNVLRFLYTDEIHISDSNLDAVLYLADKYDIPLLLERCSAFMMENVEYETACYFLSTANRFNLQKVVQRAIEIICMDYRQIFFRSEDFLGLNLSDLKLIASSEILSCTEKELLDGMLRWAEKQCKDQEKEATNANKKACLGDVFYDIRFPIMASKDLIRLMSDQSLLTETDLSDISRENRNSSLDEQSNLSSWYLKDVPPQWSFVHSGEKQSSARGRPSTFSSLPRRGSAPKRFIIHQGNAVLKNVDPTDGNMKMVFNAAHNVWLYGLTVYGPTLQSEFIVQMRLTQGKEGKPHIFHKNVESEGGTSYTCDVYFDKPMHIEREEEYTLHMKIFISKEVSFYRFLELDSTRSYGIPKALQLSADAEFVQHHQNSIGGSMSSHGHGPLRVGPGFKQINIITQCDQIAGLLL